MSVLYLCGPINGRSTADASNWRKRATALWPGPVLDPFRRDFRGKENETAVTAAIVLGDKRDLQNSDGVLVYFDKPSVGTSMEIFYAKQCLALPVVVVNASNAPLSPWLVYHADAIFSDIENAVSFFNTIFYS